MNRVAIAYLTKDHVNLSRQTHCALMQPDKFDLYWIDGSTTDEGREFPHKTSFEQPPTHRILVHAGVSGGPDTAVAYALTQMLKGDYEYVGLFESDVLLEGDWFERTMELFDVGERDTLKVGAVSARAYVDRILVQRDNYALMHNLGFGQVILTREAAQIALANMRTGITTDNRRTFCKLSGLDIASWWAFKANEHPITADWNQDRLLAAHGLASLALTPSPVEMIGQNPPLAEQGLAIATELQDLLRNDHAFERFVNTTRAIREGKLNPNIAKAIYRDDGGSSVYYAHQVGMLEGAEYDGDWRLKWIQGCGPFAWESERDSLELSLRSLAAPYFSVCLAGPAEFMVSGGPNGGQAILEDLTSGYSVKPQLPAGDRAMALVAPCGVSVRPLRLTLTAPGMLFFGVRTREPQAEKADWAFNWDMLPRVG